MYGPAEPGRYYLMLTSYFRILRLSFCRGKKRKKRLLRERFAMMCQNPSYHDRDDIGGGYLDARKKSTGQKKRWKMGKRAG
jgi:hypothetical protein